MVEESLIKRLMTTIKCGVCGQHYEVDNISVLGYQEDLWFVRAYCLTCHTQCLMAAVIKEDKTPAVVHDLTGAELDKFKSMGVVTADELLEMHNFLKGFDGNFSRLFGQK